MNGDFFYPPRIFGAIPSQYADLQTARVVIAPIPYDSTTDYKAGARDGPFAIIDASRNLELYDEELDRETFQVGIHTLPEVQVLMSGPEQMVGRVYEIASQFMRDDRLLVMLGGEHSLTVGMVRAFFEKKPNLSVLQLDAHADLRDQYMGTKFSHACVMRRIVELCPAVQVGVRSLSYEEHAFIQQKGLRPFFAEAYLTKDEPIADVVSALSSDVYVTIDLDVFDPSMMAAVGTPEPGGLGWYQVLRLLRAVAESRHVVGFDVVELCPREGPIACAFLAAKLVYKLIGYCTRG